jgi:hypothetical protein
MNLRFLPAAREELDAATSYLEDRIQGLGEEFLEDVERTGTLYTSVSSNWATLGRNASRNSAPTIFVQLGIPHCRWAIRNRSGRTQTQAPWLLAPTGLTANNRFERSRGRMFGEPRRESMIWTTSSLGANREFHELRASSYAIQGLG